MTLCNTGAPSPVELRWGNYTLVREGGRVVCGYVLRNGSRQLSQVKREHMLLAAQAVKSGHLLPAEEVTFMRAAQPATATAAEMAACWGDR